MHPDFIGNPRHLRGNFHAWSHISIDKDATGIRKSLLLMFGTKLKANDPLLHSYDDKLEPVIEPGWGIFETLTETTAGTPLPRWAAYEATRQMIVFGSLTQNGNHNKDRERRLHTYLAIEFANLSS